MAEVLRTIIHSAYNSAVVGFVFFPGSVVSIPLACSNPLGILYYTLYTYTPNFYTEVTIRLCIWYDYVLRLTMVKKVFSLSCQVFMDMTHRFLILIT